jgi:hypothetical protein
MKNTQVIIFISLYSIISTIIILNLFFTERETSSTIYSTPKKISTDTVYMSIDSLDSKRDTIKLYYETKVSNYHILPSSERIELFTSRINR